MLYAERLTRLRRFGRATNDAYQDYLDILRDRDDEVDAADRDGWSVREIQRAIGVGSPQTVERILARLERRRQQRTPEE